MPLATGVFGGTTCNIIYMDKISRRLSLSVFSKSLMSNLKIELSVEPAVSDAGWNSLWAFLLAPLPRTPEVAILEWFEGHPDLLPPPGISWTIERAGISIRVLVGGIDAA